MNDLTTTKVSLLNIEQVQRCLAILALARVPACLVGGVGCGKTTAVESFAKKLNRKLVTKILTFAAEEDLGGVPVADTKEAAKPGWVRVLDYWMPVDIASLFHEACTDILFLDEYDRAREAVQNASMQYTLGGHINGLQVAEGVFTILAMNGESDSYTTPLSAAAVTRVCTLFVSAQADGNQESYDRWALENGVHEVIRGFARFCPDLVKSHDQFEELAKPTPRTRDMAGRIMEAIDQVAFKTDDILLPLFAGVIGRAAAVQLIEYRRMHKSLPDPQTVLDDPMGAPVPEEASSKYAMVACLTSKARGADQGEAVLKYAIRCGRELASFAVGVLPVRCPEACTTPTYIEFLNTQIT